MCVMQEGSIFWASGNESAAGVRKRERESERAMGVALLTARPNISYIITHESFFYGLCSIQYFLHTHPHTHTQTFMPHLCIPVHPAANSAAMLRTLCAGCCMCVFHFQFFKLIFSIQCCINLY